MRRKRNAFVVHPLPAKPMSKRLRPPAGFDSAPPPDLADVVAWWTGRVDGRERFRWALRDSVDQLLDGERTGHWCYQHFGKTEKTHLGTVIELTLAKEFDIPQGDDLDWKVAGHDLDCKFSKDVGGWEIPMEMYRCSDHGPQSGKRDHPALLVWLDDDHSHWAAGIVRITDERLKFKDPVARVRQYNRDNKRHLSSDGMTYVHWLWGGLQGDLPENVLRQMNEQTRAKILNASLSGQKRVNELFKNMTGKLLSRHVINTVGQQDDAPKRVRDARHLLRGIRPQGYLVLGHQESHPQIAEKLGLPTPEKGEWVSVRVAPVSESSDRPKVRLSDGYWAVAHDDEPPVVAPALPRGRIDEDD